MRPLLAPFMLLAAAAGSAIAAAVFAVVLGPTPLTADPATLQVVSSTPTSVQLDPAGQVLRLSATNSKTGQRIEESFSLSRQAMGSSALKGIKPAEGEHLHLYQISTEELERYAEVQARILGWNETRVSANKLVSLNILPSGCVQADADLKARLSTFWLSVDEGDSFAPIVKQIDPAELAANAGEHDAVHTC